MSPTISALDSSKDESSWNVEEENETEVKELGRSKWSNVLDEDDTEQTEPIKGNLNALSGLIQAYGKEAKSVRWGDQVCIILITLFGHWWYRLFGRCVSTSYV